MTKEEELFHQLGQAIDNSEKGQLFGKPCYKINTKAYCCFFQNSMVFKLNGQAHKKALALEDASLFDPSGKNRPMKEWVQVPFEHNELWAELVEQAVKYLSEKNNI
ncbi:MAG TPA: hypothetical protein ENK21_10555 [Trueperaceae bacterium]|nr:hypothetical protein [Trueperaceae bacterium]